MLHVVTLAAGWAGQLRGLRWRVGAQHSAMQLSWQRSVYPLKFMMLGGFHMILLALTKRSSSISYWNWFLTWYKPCSGDRHLANQTAEFFLFYITLPTALVSVEVPTQSRGTGRRNCRGLLRFNPHEEDLDPSLRFVGDCRVSAIVCLKKSMGPNLPLNAPPRSFIL